jgi:hypothetical protein
MNHFFLAYIDPGSGALLLQAIVAGAVGGLMVFRNAVSVITSKLFGRRQSVEPPASDLNQPGQ